MARKTTRSQPTTTLNSTGDITHLQSVARKLLHYMETMIERLPSADAQEWARLEQNHALLLGTKASMVTALVQLSELLIHVQGVSAPATTANQSEQTHTPTLSAEDVALVEAFIQKIKHPTSGE